MRLGVRPTSGHSLVTEEELMLFPPQSAPFMKSENNSFAAAMHNTVWQEETTRFLAWAENSLPSGSVIEQTYNFSSPLFCRLHIPANFGKRNSCPCIENGGGMLQQQQGAAVIGHVDGDGECIKP